MDIGETKLASLVSTLMKKDGVIRVVRMVRFKLGLTAAKSLRTSKRTLRLLSA